MAIIKTIKKNAFLRNSFVMLALICWINSALAYQEGGHYYSVLTIINNLIPKQPNEVSIVKPTPKQSYEASIIALCAQLPDEVYELDAFEVYTKLKSKIIEPSSWFNLAKWVFKDSDDDPQIKHLIAVQHLLHGLTGGNADDLLKVAKKIVNELSKSFVVSNSGKSDIKSLCALGFGMHLYGDAYAHRQINKSNNDPTKMYRTGMGHARDQRYPDQILYHKPFSNDYSRSELWRDYLKNTPSLFSKVENSFLLPQDFDKNIIEPIIGLNPDSADDKTIIRILVDKLTNLTNNKKPYIEVEEGKSKKTLENHDNEPCQDFLKGALKNLADDFKQATPNPIPTCMDIWKQYKPTAVEAFKNVSGSRDIRYKDYEYSDPEF